MIMCWNPPQVPKHATPFSRAYRIAQSVWSIFLYGLPGATQMPEKRSNKVLSISSVDTQMPSTSTPDAERECSMAAPVEICGGKVGVYSPMIAIDRFTLPLQLTIEYNYARITSRPSKTMTAWLWIRNLSATSSTSMKPVRFDD